MSRFWLATTAIGVIAACASPLAAQPAQPPAQTAPAPAAMNAAFEAYMQTAVRDAAFTGTVLVARDGKPVFEQSYGMASQELSVPNRSETVYDIQSITKSFTALLIMMLQEEGRLSVADKACTYLTDCPEAWQTVTIEQLLMHTSGIEGYSRLEDWDETLDSRTYAGAGAAALVRKLPLRFAPGEDWRYSNTGYILLARIIERVSGKTLPQMYQERIFTPLGMAHTGFSNSRLVVLGRATGYYSLGSTFIHATPASRTTSYGDGGIFSTAHDLLLWDRALHADTLISRASYEQMIAKTRNNYGYGWEVRTWSGRRQIGHAGSGSGFSTQIARFIDDGLTVIVLSNSDEASAGGVTQALAAIQFGETPRMPVVSSKAIFLDAITAGGVDAAIARYREMKAARPDAEAFKTDELLVSAGYDLWGVPEPDKAKQVFEFALAEFPRSAYSHDGLADVAAYQGDYATAIRHFEASLALDPTNEYAVKGLQRVRALQAP